MRTLIGFVTFGNLPFTQLCVRGIRETATRPYDLFGIVGQPDDRKTADWLASQGVEHLHHSENVGFPASVNDLYDEAFVRGGYANLIIIGNDVVPYPGAIDHLIDHARESGHEWICASQFDAASLVARYPEARRYFAGEKLSFTDFTARPWMLHEPARLAELAGGADRAIEENVIKDVRNLCLFKRSVFDRLGYADANFWPGGYFEDNDYCRRAILEGVKACGLPRAAYFHFWSRTIHQGEGRPANDRHFGLNAKFYADKWGGAVGAERWEQPFNGLPFFLPPAGPSLPGPRSIFTRDREAEIIAYWRKRGR